MSVLNGAQRALVAAITGKEGSSEMVVLAEPEASVTAEVVEITPGMAKALLEMNTVNRILRPTTVARYARDMKAGAWVLNGETIKRTVSGRIIDGQHRLHAVVAANVPVEAIVVPGLREEGVQETVDRNAPRNIADALRMNGENNVHVLSGAIALTIVLQSPTPSMVAQHWPSTPEALAYLEANPGIRESVHYGEMVRKVISYPSTAGAALHHLFAKIDEDDADEFFKALANGIGLTDDSPILKLRDLAIKEISAPRRMERMRLSALTIKAWNAWRRGTPMVLLGWKTGGSKPEAFPRPE